MEAIKIYCEIHDYTVSGATFPEAKRAKERSLTKLS